MKLKKSKKLQIKNSLDFQNDFVDDIYKGSFKNIGSALKSNIFNKSETKSLISIYRRNLIINLTKSIKLTYPLIFEKISDKQGKVLIEQYIKTYRSFSSDLDEYTKSFYKFLKNRELFYLSELTKLENNIYKSYLAKDFKLLDVEKLQKVNVDEYDKLYFNLNESVFLLKSKYNLLSKKKGVKKDCYQYYITFRLGGEIETKKITQKEFMSLKSIKSGFSIYEIFNRHKIDIGKFLKKFASNHIINDFYIK